MARTLSVPLRRALVGALSAAAALAGLAAPASAAELTVQDARGDLHKVDMDPESDSLYVTAPGAREGDLARATFAHNARRVVVTARFVELAPVGKDLVLSVRMRDQDGKKHVVMVEATRRNRAGRAELQTYRGRPTDCTVTHKISYAKNTVRASLPRECVGNPRTLEFTMASYRLVSGNIFLDHPHNTRPEPKVWTGKVHRG